MSVVAYRVRIVVDESFGERLADLPPGEPVWIAESPANTPVAKRLWTERPGRNHLTGITIFRRDAEQPAPLLLGILDQVDLHHGYYSADPPYTEVETYGVGLSEAIERSLGDLGFTEFRTTPGGFLATKASN
jgi:hypothetical protein